MSRWVTGWRMPGWNVGSWPVSGLRIEQVVAVKDSVTCGYRVNLGTRTAPAERANVREFRGLTTTLDEKGSGSHEHTQRA